MPAPADWILPLEKLAQEQYVPERRLGLPPNAGYERQWLSRPRVGITGQTVALMESHPTRYVTIGDAQVAYQIAGNAVEDLVWCYSFGAQVDLLWQLPIHAELLRHLATVRRLIVFDRRGSGASDPVPLNALPTWEALAEDLTAVLDAAGSERTAVMAGADTGPISILFAAMHPERISHLILVNTTARYMVADDYEIGMSPTEVDFIIDFVRTHWGTDDFTRVVIPSHADNVEVSAWSQMFRASATPATAAAQYSYVTRNVDVRTFLPLVQVPTLIIHSSEAQFPPIEHGRYLAAQLPHATLVEHPGTGIVLGDAAAADVIEFLTGERQMEVDRVLATVLFTDIVGSTKRAASIGDQRWRSLLDAHDRAVREQIRRFKGREVNTVGDGFVVSFDGPARAIRCAKAINESVQQLGLQLRLGLHTGECELRGNDLSGLAVHIAARIASLAPAGEVLASSTVKDLVVGSGIEFIERGEHDLKGVPGSWRLFAVSD